MERNPVSLKRLTFAWKVVNPLSVVYLNSEEFSFDQHRWQLTLRLDSKYVRFHLTKLNSEKLTRTYRNRCFVEGKHKMPVKVTEQHIKNLEFSLQKNIWFMSKEDLQNKRDLCLINDILVFVIVFEPSEEDATKEVITEKVPDKSTSVSMDTVACLENLSFNLHHLMKDGTHSDVVLRCEERSFPAHKNILSARSQVFSAMLQADTAENRTGVIDITDMDIANLDQFLQYIYSGKFPDLSVNNAHILYTVADKYAVDSLKKLCSKFMKENLTRENACEYIVLADAHGDEDLKDYVLTFITSVELLRDKDIWYPFHNEHPKLASEVLHHAYEVLLLWKEI